MKCEKCGYDDNGTGDFAHVCGKINGLTGEAQPVKETDEKLSQGDVAGGLVKAHPAEQANGQEAVATEAAWAFANAVWAEMDRKSMPGIYMQLVVKAIVKHYTAPPGQPAREWVGLTEAEIGQAFGAYAGKGSHPARVYSAIESRLREKNAGQPAEARSVPDGYTLVPVEPTPAMVAVGDAAATNAVDEWSQHDHNVAPEQVIAAYRAMIAAAIRARSDK